MGNWPKFASSMPFGSTGLPNVGGALTSLFQSLTFNKISKIIVASQVVEETTPVYALGVMQPLNESQLLLKPEGQRVWSWYWLHAHPQLILNVDDVVEFKSVKMRVMSFKDYSEYGYVEYQLCQDYIGSDALVVTP